MTLLMSTLDSPLGPLHALASEQGLRCLQWSLPKEQGAANLSHPLFLALALQLEQYFDGSLRQFDLALDPVGTEFQREAWVALREIPYGETRSYAQQAERVGRPTAVRAIGAANGANPLGIIVPCHRVVGSDGSLTGFAGGVDLKRRLLEHEARNKTTAPEQAVPFGEDTFRLSG